VVTPLSRLLALLLPLTLGGPAPAGGAPLRARPRTVVVGPASAAEMNTRMANVEGWRSGDSGRTVRLADGRLIGFFGDSTLADGRFVHNSVVVSDGRRSWLAAAGLFPDFADGSRWWPGQAVAVGERVFLTGSRQLVRGPFDWTPLGAYLAIVDVRAGGPPVFRTYVRTPSSSSGGRPSPDSAVQWYGGLWIDGTTAYLHGVRDTEPWHVRDGGYVARVPVMSLGRLERWRFWTGRVWSADPTVAVPTIPAEGAGGTESGYTLHRRPDGRWQVTTRRYGALGDHLGRYVGAGPAGPWAPFEPLLPTPAGAYLTGAAPQIPAKPGRLLVQWSRPGTCVEWADVPAS
jgi:hypothetical protein